MLVDSHAHLDDARFEADRDAVLARAWNAGIRKIVTIGNGNGPDDMGCGVPIAEKNDWIYTTAGVHPHDAARVETRHYALLRETARHEKVVAIGEAGLDYHYDNSPRDVQREVFRTQAALAKQLNLPLIVHTREADADTEAVLRDESPSLGVVHCFTSGEGLADFALSIGFFISFSGIVTFPNARALADIACRVPSDRILVETDCPYLAPVPHRGKRNEPSFISDTARFLANVRGVSVEEFEAQTSANFDRLFAIKTS